MCNLLFISVFLGYFVGTSFGTTLGIIHQDGQSNTCAQEYYSIDPQDCTCKSLGCPASSRGSDPSVNEFASNAVATKSSAGNYVYIDEYWSYIQQISPNGTQIYSPNEMVRQHCTDGAKKGDIYRVSEIQYDYDDNILYGIAMVPNQRSMSYDSKVVSLDLKTGACEDVISGIPGTAMKPPSSCCGGFSQPTYDQTNDIFYYFGASGYPESPLKSTIIAADIPNKTFKIGFISSTIQPSWGFMFYDSSLGGLFALGYSSSKEFGIYKLSSSWGNFEDITDELVVPLGKTQPEPQAATYDSSTHMLFLFFDMVRTVMTVDMSASKTSKCDLPSSCTGNLWSFPIVLES